MSIVPKKLISFTVTALVALTLTTAAGWAEMSLSANDLTPGTLTAALTVESFEITARADKDVQIKVLGVARTADDGEVFNNSIDLRGAGGVDFRSVKFSVAEGTVLTVYLNSGSSSAARILRLVDGTGAVVLEIPAKPYVEGKAEKAIVTIPVGGTLSLTSSSGGILIYQLQLK